MCTLVSTSATLAHKVLCRCMAAWSAAVVTPHDEVGAHRLAQQASQGGLAAPRGAPEDQGWERTPRGEVAEQLPGRQQVLLPDHVRQRLRAHALRERLSDAPFVGVVVEQVHYRITGRFAVVL